MRLLFLLIFCLFSSPCQAGEISCKIKGAPCYTKSGIIILRERPSFDSKIIYSATPAKKDGRLYYSLKSVSLSEGKNWGYFKSMMPTMDGATGKFFQEEGWMPLDETFHDIDVEKSAIIFMKSEDEAVSLLLFKPDKIMVLIKTKTVQIYFPFDEASFIDTSKK